MVCNMNNQHHTCSLEASYYLSVYNENSSLFYLLSKKFFSHWYSFAIAHENLEKPTILNFLKKKFVEKILTKSQ